MDDFQGFRKIFKTRLQKHYVLFDIWVEFREFVIEWNYFAICETKKKNPDFITTCIWVIAKKKKKKNLIFFQQATSDYTVTIAHAKKKKKPYQIQITKERKCIGIESNMISVEKLQDKDGYKFAPYSDGEQEVFDTHDCQTGRTQCANSQLNFTSLILYKLKNNCSHEISDLALALR